MAEGGCVSRATRSRARERGASAAAVRRDMFRPVRARLVAWCFFRLVPPPYSSPYRTSQTRAQHRHRRTQHRPSPISRSCARASDQIKPLSLVLMLTHIVLPFSFHPARSHTRCAPRSHSRRPRRNSLGRTRRCAARLTRKVAHSGTAAAPIRCPARRSRPRPPGTVAGSVRPLLVLVLAAHSLRVRASMAVRLRRVSGRILVAG